MIKLQEKYIYLLTAAPGIIFTPFYFGFPESDGINYLVIRHGQRILVTNLYMVLSLMSYVMCVFGILLFVTSLIKLQKQYGVKPRIIFVLLDNNFVKELYLAIKSNCIAKIILLIDLSFYIIILYRW